MDVHIGEMNSVVRATDSQALLSPQVLEQIVRVVLRRVQEERELARRVADERQIHRSAVADESRAWE